MSKKRTIITAAHRRAVLQLSGSVEQKEIARKLGIHPNTVAKIQRALKLPTRMPQPFSDVELLDRIARGFTPKEIAQKFGVSRSVVYSHLKKIHLSPGDTPAKGDVAAFTEAVRKQEGPVRTLRKRYGIGIDKSYEIAHQLGAVRRGRPPKPA